MDGSLVADKKLSRRAVLGAGVAIAGAGMMARPVRGATVYPAIRRDAEQLIEALESMPYVSEGRGVPVYVMVSQTCPFCKALWRDHKRIKSAIEFRWIPLPYPQDNRNQVSQLQQSRRVADFDLYMTQALPAGDIHDDDRKAQIYNDSIARATVVRQIVKANGLSFGTPIWLWKKRDVIEYNGGYDEASFRTLIQHLAA